MRDPTDPLGWNHLDKHPFSPLAPRWAHNSQCMTTERFSEFLSPEEIERWANIVADEFANPHSSWRAELLEGWEMTDYNLRVKVPFLRIRSATFNVAYGVFDCQKLHQHSPCMR